MATTSTTLPAPVISHEKPERFNGTEFKRWQQKMLFYLTTLNLSKYLREDCPTPKEGETDAQTKAAVDAWIG